MLYSCTPVYFCRDVELTFFHPQTTLTGCFTSKLLYRYLALLGFIVYTLKLKSLRCTFLVSGSSGGFFIHDVSGRFSSPYISINICKAALLNVLYKCNLIKKPISLIVILQKCTWQHYINSSDGLHLLLWGKQNHIEITHCCEKSHTAVHFPKR